jgi:hypothetical protein
MDRSGRRAHSYGSGRQLEIRALLPVAVAAQKLEVFNGGGSAQRHRDHMIVLKVEVAACTASKPIYGV